MVSAAAESLPPDEETTPGSMPSVARGHPALDAVWDVDVMSNTLYRGRVFESLEQVWETSAGCGATRKSGPMSLAGLPPATYRAQREARSSLLKLPPCRESLPSQVISTFDGDTIEVLHNQHPERIRLPRCQRH